MRKWRAIVGASFVVLLVGTVFVLRGGSDSGLTNRAREGVAVLGNSSVAAASERTALTRARTTGPIFGTGTYQGVSPAVRDLPLLPAPPSTAPVPREGEHAGYPGRRTEADDPVVQSEVGDAPMPGPIENFDGICGGFASCTVGSTCQCLPPDTIGEAGLNHYVQMVNSSFAIWLKDGTQLQAPRNINQLWSDAGGRCQTQNDGDPIVLYDQLADRWFLSQFVATAPNALCIAISTTGNPMGTYHRYEFGTQTVFHDYPKFGVWPDGYYATSNQFNGATGAGAFVFERDKMLNGLTARYVFFGNWAPLTGLPADLDGMTLPPAGSPGLIASVDDSGTLPGSTTQDLRIWKFAVDWSTSPNPTATFGVGAGHAPNFTVEVAPFTRAECVRAPAGDCVPQKGGPQTLDVLGDRIMNRLAYRNYGTHEALALNHSVKVDPTVDMPVRIGVRWYEVRNPQGVAGSPVIHQQGTYAPTDPLTNPLWRWMGSAAMDRVGNLAIGYSASGPNDFPHIRYAGRLADDPLGQLPQTEQALPAPYGGPQTQVQGRWGDYSNLTIDPYDDCTFWVTNEYLEAADVVLGSWRTRIGSFRFPDCQGPTGVAVTKFSARWTKAGVNVAWRTRTEAQIAGFHVSRASGKSWHKVNRTLVAAKNAGSVSRGSAYRLLDRNARRNRDYTYRLEVVDLKGKRSWYGAGTVPVR